MCSILEFTWKVSENLYPLNKMSEFLFSLEVLGYGTIRSTAMTSHTWCKGITIFLTYLYWPSGYSVHTGINGTHPDVICNIPL